MKKMLFACRWLSIFPLSVLIGMFAHQLLTDLQIFQAINMRYPEDHAFWIFLKAGALIMLVGFLVFQSQLILKSYMTPHHSSQ
ncbi:hypothetical protein [Kushneria phosphatilytica]|uniref:Uncharacterized protein n=1 Tax=Kushneria phosphatilytica TaxID=657387 RepID=A0A1S1NL67_9GAMM|nr:hypothetical protein [Kushneria phosphatilytica]OHV07506.1 hypothetical protein BH688_14840 [Kushneria phosphatilytica]QEL09988.1 hypothetical protein FY550_01795 [Kushneria phosphatilytica]